MRIQGLDSGIKTLDDLIRSVDALSDQLKRVINGGVTIGDNFDAVSFSVADSGTADTAIQIDHGLGRAPTGMIITQQDKAGSVYTSGSTFGTASGAVVFTDVANMQFKGYFF